MRSSTVATVLLMLTGCGGVGSGGLEASSTCASGLVWTGGNAESPLMNPGHACIACHTAERKGPTFAVAGTVYAALDQANGCAGSAATGTKIELTDANGRVTTLTPNEAGNFSLQGTLAKPYRAKLITAAGERAMAAPQTNGDCNACHTAAGLEGAPGRISP